MYILISKCTSISLGPHNFPFAFSSDFAEVHLGARKKMSLRLFYLGLLDIICSTLHRSGHDNFRRMLPTDSEESYNDNNGLGKKTQIIRRKAESTENVQPQAVFSNCAEESSATCGDSREMGRIYSVNKSMWKESLREGSMKSTNIGKKLGGRGINAAIGNYLQTLRNNKSSCPPYLLINNIRSNGIKSRTLADKQKFM